VSNFGGKRYSSPAFPGNVLPLNNLYLIHILSNGRSRGRRWKKLINVGALLRLKPLRINHH